MTGPCFRSSAAEGVHARVVSQGLDGWARVRVLRGAWGARSVPDRDYYIASTGEGRGWIRGHHAAGSKAVYALRAAQALARR